MINSCGRLLGGDELLEVLWNATIAGLNPDGAAPGESASDCEEFCLALDVRAARNEIEARLRAKFVDELVGKIARKIPGLTEANLAAIREIQLASLAPLAIE